MLSIQSSVAYGHVGNRAAVPALQALGRPVWPVDTVAFSNHPGHGTWRGTVRPPGEIAEILRGLHELGVLPGCQALLTGYLGHPAQAGTVAAALAGIRTANPAMLYCCDPVIGDDGRVFVADGVADAIAGTLLPAADMATPNLFELGWLTGGAVAAETAIIAAARALRRRGPASVIVTGIPAGDRVHALWVGEDGIWRAAAPRHARGFNGCGDLFAALLLGWRLAGAPPPLALARAMGGMAAVTGETVRRGGKELALTAALPRLADPARTAEVTRLA